MTATEPRLPAFPDNDDPTAYPVQPDILAQAEAVLANPEAKVSDLGDIRALFQGWIAEVKGRQSVKAEANLDSDSSSELSPEQVFFLGTLKARYERNEHHLACHNEVAWSRVEAKLSANPAKLDALKKMDESGGAPDMTGVEEGEFILDDIAQKLPDSRRNLTYSQAVARAEAMGGGVKLTHPDRYMELGNKMKIMMETRRDWVWLDNSDRQDLLDKGDALYGLRSFFRYIVNPGNADGANSGGAFRCSLRV